MLNSFTVHTVRGIVFFGETLKLLVGEEDREEFVDGNEQWGDNGNDAAVDQDPPVDPLAFDAEGSLDLWYSPCFTNVSIPA